MSRLDMILINNLFKYLKNDFQFYQYGNSLNTGCSFVIIWASDKDELVKSI